MKLLSVICLLASSAASAAPLSCPTKIRDPNGSTLTPLAAVRVISYPAGRPPTKGEPFPIHAPDSEFHVRGSVRQTWHVNEDSPYYQYQLHCIYSNNHQFLSFDIPVPLKTCTASDDLRTSTFTMTCR